MFQMRSMADGVSKVTDSIDKLTRVVQQQADVSQETRKLMVSMVGLQQEL